MNTYARSQNLKAASPTAFPAALIVYPQLTWSVIPLFSSEMKLPIVSKIKRCPFRNGLIIFIDAVQGRLSARQGTQRKQIPYPLFQYFSSVPFLIGILITNTHPSIRRTLQKDTNTIQYLCRILSHGRMNEPRIS